MDKPIWNHRKVYMYMDMLEFKLCANSSVYYSNSRLFSWELMTNLTLNVNSLIDYWEDSN